MATDKDADGWVFKRSDCIVEPATITNAKGNQVAPRGGGMQAGIVNGAPVMLSGAQLNAVTARHIPTGVTVTVGKFHPSRNKELALMALEQKINKIIEDEKARVAKHNAKGV